MSAMMTIRGMAVTRTVGLSVALLVVACRAPATPAASSSETTMNAPPELLGAFQDDYRITYQISRDVWQQGSRTRYLVSAWHVDSQYLIARNADDNPSAPGRWTRIDWMRLEGMAPFTWAYCLSAYEAATRAEAEATRIAQRDTPRTGCNRFPFSRMQRMSVPGRP
jgi:hypothetical protein